MSERINTAFTSNEQLHPPRRTMLSMIVDPPKQSPATAGERVRTFLQSGGSAILIGGSGFIEPEIFEETVETVTTHTVGNPDVPVWILPGHLSQIPKKNTGISGVLNYVHILGSKGNFEEVYPKRGRDYVASTLEQRQITSIRTLYILCGDSNASVSQVSGILPLDLSSLQAKIALLQDVRQNLSSGVDCVFFEAGSNSAEPVNRDVVVQVRNTIDAISPDTSLIVSGGISTPEHAKFFAGIADYVNIGGYFERNGTHDTADFVRALQ